MCRENHIYISDLLHIIMFYLDGFVESTNKNENDVTIFQIDFFVFFLLCNFLNENDSHKTV